MKNTTDFYAAKMYSCDFEKNTITLLIEGEFSIKAGDYYIISKKEYASRIEESARSAIGLYRNEKYYEKNYEEDD